MKTCAFEKEADDGKKEERNIKLEDRIIAFKKAELVEVHQAEKDATKSLDSWFTSLDSIAQLKKEIKNGKFFDTDAIKEI